MQKCLFRLTIQQIKGNNMRNAIVISSTDNVAVVVEPVRRGEPIIWIGPDHRELSITAATDIPIYHKCALRDIAPGEKIIKYGEHIGEAGAPIRAGEHVHTHNVVSIREELV